MVLRDATGGEEVNGRPWFSETWAASRGRGRAHVFARAAPPALDSHMKTQPGAYARAGLLRFGIRLRFSNRRACMRANTLACAWLLSAMLLAAATLVGCHAELAHRSDADLLRASPGKAMLRTELYFGAARHDGTAVTDDAWRAFLRDEVTPRFPDGFTILDSRGQWRGPDGRIVEEPSRVLIILYEPDDADVGQRIEQIRATYQQRFDQDAVMRVDSVQRVAF